MTDHNGIGSPENLPVRLSDSSSASQSDETSPDAENQPRRKVRGRGRGKRLAKLTGMTSRFRTLSTAQRYDQTVRSRPARVLLNPFAMIGTSNGLDPFFPLPPSTSDRDRGLLQYYFTTLPSAWYATTTSPAFSVVRDVSMPQSIDSDVYMGWMLLAAEHSLKNISELEKVAVIACRRASNYRKIRELLNDPATHSLDSTIAILAVAGSAELRLGSPVLAREHLVAVLNLLGQRQGLRTIQRMVGPSAVTTCHVLHHVGIPMIFTTPTAFSRALYKCETMLKEMYAWNLIIRDGPRDQKPFERSGHKPHNSLDDTECQETPGRASYWQIRRQCLGSSSHLACCLIPGSHELAEAATRCLAGSLFSLNSIMYNLRDDKDTALNLILDVDRTVRNSWIAPSVGSIEQATFAAKASMTLPALVAYCAMRNGQWLDEEWRMVPPALRTWESLEFVELIMLLSSQRRQQILSLMKLWLTQDVYGLSHPGIRGDLDLEEIKMEMAEQWNAESKPARERGI